MKYLHAIVKVVLMLLLLTGLSGCGTDELRGKLELTSVTATQNAGQASYSTAFSFTYTDVKEVLPSTEFTITETLINMSDGSVLWSSSNTQKMSSLGGTSFTFNGGRPVIPQIAGVAQLYVVRVQVGDLVGQKSATIQALSPLAVSPNIVTFAATDAVASTKTVSISGGVAPFAAAANNALVTAAVSGNTLTISRSDAGVGGVSTITVTDSQGNVANVSVTLTAIP